MADEMAAQGGAKSPQDAPGTVPFGGTVTIFFSDIRGFTDYTEQFGDEAAYRILREHNTIVRKQIEAFGGAVVKTQGDSFMVAFTTARGAILCAIAIQRAVGEANRNHSGPRIAIGIGINTGEPIQEGGDYFGSMVNLAARICATADPGQILVAETTRHVAGRIESVEYVDRGLHELKGFPEARRLCEVIWRPPESIAPDKGPAARVGHAEDVAVTVQGAIGVLNRVLGLAHLDDPTFAPLIECQAKAGDLRLAFSRALSERRPINMKQAEDLMLPFENLMTLIVERGTLNEQRWEELEANVARSLGRPLVTAAARGRLSVAGPEQAEPAPTNLAYTSYLLATVRGGSYAEGVGVVLPCYWIYAAVGKELLRSGSPDPRYQRWIATYGGDDYAGVVADVITELDRVSHGLSDDERTRVRSHFQTTSRYEWMFWQMGWVKESWPV